MSALDYPTEDDVVLQEDLCAVTCGEGEQGTGTLYLTKSGIQLARVSESEEVFHSVAYYSGMSGPYIVRVSDDGSAPYFSFKATSESLDGEWAREAETDLYVYPADADSLERIWEAFKLNSGLEFKEDVDADASPESADANEDE